MKLAAITLFIGVEHPKCFQWLTEAVEFALHKFSAACGAHAGIPANAIQPSWHMGRAEQYSFMLQASCEAIAEAAFQSAVDEQVWVT